MSINKLKNSWIKDDNIVTGTYDNVSLLNNGKTELQQDVTCNNNLTIKNYAICKVLNKSQRLSYFVKKQQ